MDTLSPVKVGKSRLRLTANTLALDRLPTYARGEWQGNTFWLVKAPLPRELDVRRGGEVPARAVSVLRAAAAGQRHPVTFAEPEKDERVWCQRVLRDGKPIKCPETWLGFRTGESDVAIDVRYRAIIERLTLPGQWCWVEGASQSGFGALGYFVDGDLKGTVAGRLVRFEESAA